MIRAAHWRGSSAMSTVTLAVLLAIIACGNAGKDKPVFSEEIKEIIDHVHNECVGITGVAEEDIRNCENGIFKEDQKLKCYMFCLLEEASLVDTLRPTPAPKYIHGGYLDREHRIAHLKSRSSACDAITYLLADEDGVVDYDMLVSLIPEQYFERVSKMIFSCKHLDTPDKDKCQRAFDVHKCSYEKDPDIYFLF